MVFPAISSRRNIKQNRRKSQSNVNALARTKLDKLPEMMTKPIMTTEVWAQLWLCQKDCLWVRKFLAATEMVDCASIVNRLHLTVYHARGPMPGITALSEPANMILPTIETRFMVMKPGGEVAQPNVLPGDHKVGIRVQKCNIAYPDIQEFRARLLEFETPSVLGRCRPSTANRSAFGAPRFQPHMTILRPGNFLGADLTNLGEMFRREIRELTYDRFSIDVKLRLAEPAAAEEDAHKRSEHQSSTRLATELRRALLHPEVE
jgi:hypothetical protein